MGAATCQSLFSSLSHSILFQYTAKFGIIKVIRSKALSSAIFGEHHFKILPDGEVEVIIVRSHQKLK